MNLEERFLFLANLLNFRYRVPKKAFLIPCERTTEWPLGFILPPGLSCHKDFFLSLLKGFPSAAKYLDGVKQFFANCEEEHELKKLEALNAFILTPFSNNYPFRLKHIENPPLALYCQGNKELLLNPMVSIVGSRASTVKGKLLAAEVSQGLSMAGVTVVSGFARGIDGSAHKGALKGGMGATVAVIGTGLDVPYPAEHKYLRTEVVTGGLFLSEFPFEEQPLAWHFPLRNRIIAALSEYTLVVEAGKGSGSLITAKLALDQGAEVMAIPGEVGRGGSFGTNQLIRDGAVLVRNFTDVLETMGVTNENLALSSLNVDKLVPPLSDLLALISDGCSSLDELLVSSGLAYGSLNRLLFELHSRGFIRRDSGNRYNVVAFYKQAR